VSARLFDRLVTLPHAAPSAARARHVRARCHRTLARRRRARALPWRRAIQYWPHVVAGLSGLYFVDSVRQVLDVWGLL
jgi:hypothetical protein